MTTDTGYNQTVLTWWWFWPFRLFESSSDYLLFVYLFWFMRLAVTRQLTLCDIQCIRMRTVSPM